MLQTVGVNSMGQLIDETVPADIRMKGGLEIGPGYGERELIERLATIAGKNRVLRSFIGMGYSDCITPPVIQRNVLENPAWYTQYTAYQAEISQGRLEALLNFQTAIADLTGLPLANASLLDEATAAAEAMTMCWAVGRRKRSRFFVADSCHPQTIAVMHTRAQAVGIEITVGDWRAAELDGCIGALVQYPCTHGEVFDYADFADRVHAAGGMLVVAADLLALALLRAPGEFGADVAVGSSQRFGVPLGYGGPHAAYFATSEAYKRQIPGRIIGMSKDTHGAPALRMALQTREQHIRRDKATSNICTSQVLLAVMAGAYAVYHGPEGLTAIATRVHGLTRTLATGLELGGFDLGDQPVFDTLCVGLGKRPAGSIHAAARERGMNLRPIDDHRVGISLDETTTVADVEALLEVFECTGADVRDLAGKVNTGFAAPHARQSSFLTHPVFHAYRTEHEMLRYLFRLAARDLSLTTSMISLGSCTMKLNGTSEMLPVTWPEFGSMHPFAPLDQAAGYTELLTSLERSLCEITGFAAASLQPNAGSQGEFCGLLVISAYHKARGDENRDVCLIPASAHGTNPASAVLAGLRVVPVACDASGNIEVDDLRTKAKEHSERLAALMVTYPSTHGVFEESIREICDVVHEFGGQVYMDGANMNAQVGLCRPGDFGADVCHLNLHKTFCIPHGGGGPGAGPIAMAAHLAPFMPGHPIVTPTTSDEAIGAVAAAPWGSPSVLPISWVYIELMGSAGLKHATEVAILSANYMARRLSQHFPILYSGKNGRVAHEFILDLRPLERTSGVVGEDVAKRLMDYGFHAPTLSFPVVGTLMIEPTESESKAEVDRLCDALISIRGEIREIEEGQADRSDNVLKNAPHTAASIAVSDWQHGYSREQAAFPVSWVRENKFWPTVGRVDNGHGDKHLICTCPPMESYTDEPEPEVASSLR